MASQTCEQCGAVVASDEQFCPSCGTFIDPMSRPRPRPRRRTTSGQVISVSSDGPSNESYEEFSLEEPPPAERGSATTPTGGGGRAISCPSCGAVNPANNRHCQECGARLRQGPLPTAPRPAVQATAGVRAALAISGLLLGVILIALFFNIFNGENPEVTGSTSTTSTTVPQVAEAGPIEILSETCTPQGIGNLVCSNLTAGTFGQGNEYQVNWEETADQGVIITLTFFEPMAITEIRWTNIEDPTRFRRNYRASSISITAQDSLTAVPVSLMDTPGTQTVRYTSLNTTLLEIHVIDAYTAQVVDEDVFDELAIDEITVIGRPVTPTATPTTVPGTTSTTAGG